MSDNISMYNVYNPHNYFDPAKLGCVLMDVECDVEYSMNAQKNQYYSDNPKTWWIKGIEERKHITVLYGFLPMVEGAVVKSALQFAMDNYDGVDTRFDDGEFPMLCLRTQVRPYMFKNFGTDEFDCWVIELDPDSSDSLKFVREILCTLPHVRTFAEYKPHITLGYFQKGKVTPEDFGEIDYWFDGTGFRLGGGLKDA